MGRNIPWRKTLGILFCLTSLNQIFSQSELPIQGKIHSTLLKSTLNNDFNELRPTQNNYKLDKIFDLENIDEKVINSQIDQLNSKTWEKYLNITFNRLLPYRDFIATEISKQKVPIEILYLPIVESAALPKATSRVGATGLWQFMSNSSSAYNMKTTEWLEERRDFKKSTVGAISKLKYNYEQTGDWLLALAAYNCGLTRVKNIIKRTGISNFWELSKRGLLPKETANYVPKLIAVSRLFQEKHKYNITIKWDSYSWVDIELNKAIDLRILSQKANIPLKILEDGNSELLYSVTPPTITSYKLKVPSIYTDSVISAINSQQSLMEFYKYKVKSGDTLSEIGYYYGISTPSLIMYNPGVSARNLRIGKTLLVPAVRKVEPYGSQIITAIFKNDYTVKENDTLWGISIIFDTTIEELALNNGLNINDYIKKGMRLKVP